MTSMRLSSRDHRTLLRGGALVLALSIVGRGVPAWLVWTATARTAAAALIIEAARAEASVAAAGSVRDSLRVRRSRYATTVRSSLLGGTSAASAGATLAGALSDMATASGVQLGTVQIGADTLHAGALTRVWVRADLTGDVRGITQLLSTVEQGPELLAVRELSITQPELAASVNRAESLRASMVIEGLALSRESQPRAPQPRARMR
jgi:hypothetical protein